MELLRALIAEEDLDTARTVLREVIDGFPIPTAEAQGAHVALLDALAPLAEQLGLVKESLAMQESALALRAKLLPADDRTLLAAKERLAFRKLATGDAAGAHPLFEELLTEARRRFPSDHHSVLKGMNNLAVTKASLGDHAGARELFEAMLTVWGRLLPESDRGLLQLKGNLAATRSELGDHAGAKTLCEEVLRVWETNRPNEDPDVLKLKANLASEAIQLGDLEGASALLEEVVAARTRLGRSGDMDALMDRTSLATVRLKLGDSTGACRALEEIQDALTGRVQADSHLLLTVRRNLVLALEAAGEHQAARELAASLLEGMRSRARALRLEAGRPAREGARVEFGRLATPLSLGAAPDSEHALDPLLFATIESLRLASVASSDAAHALAARPELSGLADRVAALRARLNDLAAVPSGGSSEQLRAALVALADERDGAERELRKRLAEGGAFVAEVDAPALGERLGTGTAAVSYLRHVDAPVSDSLLAFLVRPGGSVRRIDLGSAAELEALVQAWRNALGRPLQERGIGATRSLSVAADLDALGRRLRERVLDPVLAAAGEVKVLHVELDDFLYLVPLDALPLEDGVVGERVAIREELTLARLLRSDPRTPLEGGLTLLGGIDYDAEPSGVAIPRLDATTPPFDPPASRSGASSGGFLALPGSAPEVRAIAALYAEAFELEPVALAAASATKAALHEAAPRTRFLHVATHGWFASESIPSSADPSAGRGLAPRSSMEATRIGFAPETLCGLALAGANRGKDALGRQPGILTAEELAAFDLRGCELAVLSACETNVGVRRAGQGIQSLGSALHTAGARATITSLWSVDDAATRRLFEVFYGELWKEKRGKAEALWKAKLALRSEGHPPQDWAGWVLSGDPD